MDQARIAAEEKKAVEESVAVSTPNSNKKAKKEKAVVEEPKVEKEGEVVKSKSSKKAKREEVDAEEEVQSKSAKKSRREEVASAAADRAANTDGKGTRAIIPPGT